MTGIEAGPSIDYELLGELRQVLEDDFVDLMEAYLDDTPEKLRRLSAAVERADLEEVLAVTHSLKGTSRNLGVTVMAGMCQELEQWARAGGSDRVTDLLKAIEVEFAKVEAAMTAFMEGY